MVREGAQLFWKGSSGGGGDFVLGRFVDGRGGPDADIAVCGKTVSQIAKFRVSKYKNVPRPPVANRSPSGETWQE